MTTFEPGAKLVFTYPGTWSPSCTALRARRPAAIITAGFDVFVQLVIAAMTTAPSRRLSRSVPTVTSTSRSGAVAASDAADASRHEPFARARGIRSCGLFGPARDVSTLARSRSSTVEYSGCGASALRNSPCSRL